MIMAFVPYAFGRPLLFTLDPERAHELALDSIAALQDTPARRLWSQPRIDSPVTLAGLRFPNRIGLAAGLDKNGRCIDGLGALGFGFLEVGTVTPRAQPGNPKPRLFRLPQAHALINRLGFNNQGLSAFVANVRRSRTFRAGGGVLGLNIGKNASTPIDAAAEDYLAALDGVYPHADYVSVNISSPNTRDLRTLQGDAALGALLAALQSRRSELAARHGRRVPMFVKIAPDLDEAQRAALFQRAADASHLCWMREGDRFELAVELQLPGKNGNGPVLFDSRLVTLGRKVRVHSTPSPPDVAFHFLVDRRPIFGSADEPPVPPTVVVQNAGVSSVSSDALRQVPHRTHGSRSGR